MTTLNINQLPDADLSLGSALTQLGESAEWGCYVGSDQRSDSAAESITLAVPAVHFGDDWKRFLRAGDLSFVQAKLERRFANGFNLMISYTWSKLIAV